MRINLRIASWLAPAALASFNLQPATALAQSVPQQITYQGHLTANGSNYSGPGYFKFSIVNAGANVARGASAHANIVNGAVSSIVIDDPGSGYTTAPSVYISGAPDPISGLPQGSGATAVAIVSGGGVSSVQVQNPGSGYIMGAFVIIMSPPPSLSYVAYWSIDGFITNGNEPSFALPVQVNDGLFTVTLGGEGMCPLSQSAFSTNDAHLMIWFSPTNSGSFQLLSPNQPLNSVPYAMSSAYANQASQVVGPVPASSLTGTIGSAQLAGAVQMTNAGNVFAGNGGGLAGLNASQVTSGTLPDGQLSGNVARLNSPPTFTGNVTAQGDLIGSRLNVGAGPQLSGYLATIGGGHANQATNSYAVVAGGDSNVAGGNTATVSGGAGNQATGDWSAIAGGTGNQATGDKSAMGGGSQNQATNFNAVVGGGNLNVAGGNTATVSGGAGNEALGNWSSVPGGRYNTAAGSYSLAAGYSAKANHNGAFVWADTTGGDFASTANYQFLIRATGGVGINKNNPAGALDVNGVINATGISVNGSPLTSSPWTSAGGNIYYNAGNVGIGTASPTWPLDIQAAQSMVRLTSTSSVNGSVLEMKNSAGSPANLGVIQFNNGANAYPGQITYTGDNNLIFQVNSAEGMRITDTGAVGIGNSNPRYTLDVSGDLHTTFDMFVDRYYWCGFGSSAYTALDMNMWGSAVWDTSDERLKQDITPIPDAVETLKKLRGVTWHWNDAGLQHLTCGIETKWKSASGKPGDDQKLWAEKRREATERLSKPQMGFVAQEVERIFPDWVKTDQQGYKQVNVEHLNAVMVNAIKEQQAQIETQQAEIGVLKARLERLEKLISSSSVRQ